MFQYAIIGVIIFCMGAVVYTTIPVSNSERLSAFNEEWSAAKSVFGVEPTKNVAFSNKVIGAGGSEVFGQYRVSDDTVLISEQTKRPILYFTTAHELCHASLRKIGCAEIVGTPKAEAICDAYAYMQHTKISYLTRCISHNDFGQPCDRDYDKVISPLMWRGETKCLETFFSNIQLSCASGTVLSNLEKACGVTI